MAAPSPKCPACAHQHSTRIRFTPWGGVIGPRLMSLVRCTGCGMHYNGKSGRRVERAIRLYTAATLAVLILLAAVMIYMFASGTGTDGAAVTHGRAGLVS